MDATIERLVEPTIEPVTVELAKLHCRVTNSAEDSLFELLIATARQEAEVYMARSISLTTWRKTMDGFPDCRYIALPYPKILSVVSFQYRNQLEEWVDVDSFPNAAYHLDTSSKPGRIYLDWNAYWPTDADYTRPGSVRIDYKSGYVDSTDEDAVRAAIPPSIKQWILVRVATLYENREMLDVGLRAAAVVIPGMNGLLDGHRVMSMEV